jgi:short-subunit dehydrogenase
MPRRTALITGASSGIGEAFAEVFAAEGFDLVITARREDRLRAVAERLTRQHGHQVHVIASDLTQRDASARLCGELTARGIHVDALVNNAGYGVPGSYLASPWSRHDEFVQVMVTAVAELTHRLLPAMLERGYGRIVNVASLAGFVPAPAGHTLYAASKAFLIKFLDVAGRRDGGAAGVRRGLEGDSRLHQRPREPHAGVARSLSPAVARPGRRPQVRPVLSQGLIRKRSRSG